MFYQKMPFFRVQRTKFSVHIIRLSVQSNDHLRIGSSGVNEDWSYLRWAKANTYLVLRLSKLGEDRRRV